MKLLRTEIAPLINDVFHLDVRQQPFLWSPFHSQTCFHSHPELELHFVLEGFGKRIISNKVEPFEAGDMVFIGSNVPHLWISDPVYHQENSLLQSKVIVTYFNPKIFLQIFESIKEFEDIREMIRQSTKGIRIYGKTRDIIAEKLITLSTVKGFEKIDGLLQIMNLISGSAEKSFIANTEPDYYDDLYPDRLVTVIKFMKENLHEQITLKQVSDLACMTEQSFSRFFRKRTNKSYSQFLSDLRISHACELLIQSDKMIGDISYVCGYNSASHFCKIFKRQIGITPFQYKCSVKKNTT